MTNPTDRRQRAARETAQQFEQARADMIENWSPQFVGALQGLGEEIRDQRIVTERLVIELGEGRHVQNQLLIEKREARQMSNLLLEAIAGLTAATQTMTAVAKDMTDELAALRSMRTQNGHAKNDDLSEGKTP
jgi:hypothetical protein